MLTQNDLLQIQKLIRKETRKIVREEIEAEVGSARDELQKEMKLLRLELKYEIKDLTNRIKNLEIKAIGIQKDLAIAVKFLDKDHIETLKRVSILEEHLNISTS